MNQLPEWMRQLEQKIEANHMLKNPLYKAWAEGKLTKTTLQNYAKEYYHHVKAFPTYISAIHSRCENMDIRKSLLTNLMDEEGGSPNHPDLWRNFIMALGVKEEEINSHKPSIATQQLIQTFKKHCSQSSLGAGIASLYCYESQIPSICETKIAGLKKWYGIDQPSEYRYFTVHESADIEHSNAEKEMLLNLIKDNKEEKEVLNSADEVLNALNSFLKSLLTEEEMLSCGV